jgi:serine phosphatase RsbU (regulator of sigma subunit)/anti-sigma regulatory factor (Ser/Thr protein kinase)
VIGRGERIIGIRWIVTFVAVGLTTAVVLSVGTVAERNARRALTAELTSRLLLEARNLALTSSGVLLSDFPELTLHPLIKEKLARQPELSYAVVVDRAGIIQGHADPHRLGTPFEEPVGLRALMDGPPRSAGETLLRNDRELVASVPITHPSGKRLGHVVVAMRTSYVDAVLERARRQQSLILAISLLIGIAVSFLVLSHVLRPVATLREGIGRIAGGDLETPVRVSDGTELGLLANAINDMAAGLKKAQVEMVERERLVREMELAREIQDSILPSERIVEGPFVIEGSQRAAAEVGGDYYDYFLLPDGRIGFAVADVSGKGVAGCLIMTMLYALLRADRATASSPAALLASLDERLGETLRRGSFVTMFYGILDVRTGRLVYASAGHNPTLIYRHASRSVETLRSRGIPLGAIRGGAIRGTLEDLTITLEPGDAVLQFTDGISEAFEASGQEQFGHERMSATLRDTAPRGPRAVIDGFFERLTAWTGGGARLDDETILVLHRDPAHVPAPLESEPVGNGCGSPLPTREPDPGDSATAIARYDEARRRGSRVVLTGTSDVLDTIRGWLAGTPVLDALPARERDLLTSTLYEVCANVAEHGYARDPGREYEVWWVPAPGPAEGARSPRARAAAGTASERLRQGWFLVRDEGVPFSANEWKGQDFDDPRVRRRGRGLGLEIIHRTMRRIVYYPSTAVGNVTWMCFGGSPSPEEASHAG